MELSKEEWEIESDRAVWVAKNTLDAAQRVRAPLSKLEKLEEARLAIDVAIKLTRSA